MNFKLIYFSLLILSARVSFSSEYYNSVLEFGVHMPDAIKFCQDAPPSPDSGFAIIINGEKENYELCRVSDDIRYIKFGVSYNSILGIKSSKDLADSLCGKDNVYLTTFKILTFDVYACEINTRKGWRKTQMFSVVDTGGQDAVSWKDFDVEINSPDADYENTKKILEMSIIKNMFITTQIDTKKIEPK